jgi:hypothetical protein
MVIRIDQGFSRKLEKRGLAHPVYKTPAHPEHATAGRKSRARMFVLACSFLACSLLALIIAVVSLAVVWSEPDTPLPTQLVADFPVNADVPPSVLPDAPPQAVSVADGLRHAPASAASATTLATGASETRTPKGMPAGSRIVTEAFDTAASAAARGWSSCGNSANGQAFGWSSGGVGTGGAAGGTFARARDVSSFADTTIGTFDRTRTLRLAGRFVLANVSFDGYIRLGFFEPGGRYDDSIGLMIIEPSGAKGDFFRGYVMCDLAGEAGKNAPISLPQNTTLSFDLTWVGNADGSGTLSGTLAGQSVSVTAGPGRSTFTAFGLLCGGAGSDNVNQKTAGCYFDDLTYSKADN